MVNRRLQCSQLHHLTGEEPCWVAPHRRVVGAQVKLSITSVTDLEMLAAHFALKAFRACLGGKHVRVMIATLQLSQHLHTCVQVTRHSVTI